MRFLHTGDWHLGRTIRGRSRTDEFAAVLDEVAGIAIDEGVDAVLIAGDTFDAFSPPADAQRLLYETLSRLARERIRVVMIAGNHDSAPRMDAMTGILELAGVHCTGSLPDDEQYTALRIPSRDGKETATVVAVPWIHERIAIKYEALFGPASQALNEYAANMERALNYYCKAFAPDTVNVLLGHMMVSGAAVQQGGGERQLHLGDTYAVLGSTLPKTAQYIALGHLHKDQPVPNSPVASASFYAGSLLQLDFGEAEQAKSVRIVDAAPGLPAQPRKVPITGGRTLRNMSFKLEDLREHADRYGNDYLRVDVEVDGHVQSLFEQVRDVLPNAVDVRQVRAGEQRVSERVAVQGLAPHQLLERYYDETYAAPVPPDVLALFNTLYEEALHAPA